MNERYDDRDRRDRFGDRRRRESEDHWHSGRDSGGPGGYGRDDERSRREGRSERIDRDAYDRGRFSTAEGSEYGGNSYGGTSYGRGGDYETGRYGQIGSYGDRDAYEVPDRSNVRRGERRRDEVRPDAHGREARGSRSWYDPSNPRSHAGYGEGRLDDRRSPGAYLDEPSQFGPGPGWSRVNDDRFGRAGQDNERWRAARHDDHPRDRDRRWNDRRWNDESGGYDDRGGFNDRDGYGRRDSRDRHDDERWDRGNSRGSSRH